MKQYNPALCRGAVKVYGIYLCRWNSGVPCALHKGEMCYMEKVDKATNELIKDMIEKEEK
jgi:hypothetical protein